MFVDCNVANLVAINFEYEPKVNVSAKWIKQKDVSYILTAAILSYYLYLITGIRGLLYKYINHCWYSIKHPNVSQKREARQPQQQKQQKQQQQSLNQ